MDDDRIHVMDWEGPAHHIECGGRKRKKAKSADGRVE